MLKILIILFLSSNVLLSQNRNSNFEFSGIAQFWKIIKILESNREPSQNDWSKLFNTPGYKVLLKDEFTRDFFEDRFRLVFMPVKSENLSDALKSGRDLHHLNHYIKVRENKEKIREQHNKLRRNREHNTALKRTLEYLPQRRVSDNPPVSFVIFESNGRGSSPIVVDLAASIEWDFVSFLAHEYHHWYRSRQMQINLNKVDFKDRNLVNAFSIIEAEGIADMIDKKDWYTKPSNAISDYARRFIYDVQRTPSIIHYIDQALIQLSKHPEQISIIGRKIFDNLPQRGHTTGYFMARLILEKFSKRDLVKCVGNPFEFILLYSKAAIQSKGKYPHFSTESIKFLNNLNNKYSRK
jgi:hypothetical protein